MMTEKETKSNKALALIGLIVFLLMVVMILASCNDTSKPDKLPSNELDSNSKYCNQRFEVYTLDGCEYIVVSPGNSHFTWGSHKGDCKNPIHQYNPIDTTEKHFDCTVETIEEGDAKNKYMYTTECGIAFYSNQKYQVGETLKNFKSPKHK